MCSWRLALRGLVLTMLTSTAGAATACPCDPADDARRITAHLGAVESTLRARDTATWSEAQRAARLRNVDRLSGYIRQGEYPENDDFPGERVPYFVDDRGVYCAVAFLVAASGHHDLVDVVVERFNNARVRDMQVPKLAAWAEQEGFTLEELGEIQPDYCGGSCQSMDPCMYGYCWPNDPMKSNGCVSEPQPEGWPCQSYGGSTVDEDPCHEQVCLGGACVGNRPRDCDDGDPSTVDTCEPDVGCVNTADTGSPTPSQETEAGEDGSCAFGGRPLDARGAALLLVTAGVLFRRRGKRRGSR